MRDNRFGFARKPMPSVCPDCKSKMDRLEYGVKFDASYRQTSPSFVYNDTFWRGCECGCVIVWAHPAVFKRRHVLPLFDDRQVLQIVDAR